MFHGVIESFRKKFKENSKLQKSPELFPKLSKLVLNMFCGIFFERKIAPCSMEGRVLKNFKKKIKKLSKFQNWPKSFSKVSKRVLNMLWGDFSEFFCRVFHAGLFRVSRLKNMRSVFWTEKIWIRFSGLKIWGRYMEQIQEKNQKNLKVLKLSKSFPSVQTCFGAFFGKKSFFPLFHGGSSLRKFSKKSKKFQISKNAFNGFPKCPNVFWTSFGAMFLNFFAQCSTQCISGFLDLK